MAITIGTVKIMRKIESAFGKEEKLKFIFPARKKLSIIRKKVNVITYIPRLWC